MMAIEFAPALGAVDKGPVGGAIPGAAEAAGMGESMIMSMIEDIPRPRKEGGQPPPRLRIVALNSRRR
jgi:hypothetical protein